MKDIKDNNNQSADREPLMRKDVEDGVYEGPGGQHQHVEDGHDK